MPPDHIEIFKDALQKVKTPKIAVKKTNATAKLCGGKVLRATRPT